MNKNVESKKDLVEGKTTQEEAAPRYKFCFSKRFFTTVLLFVVLFNMTTARFSVTFALICMVRQPNTTSEDPANCPAIDEINSDMMEFEWPKEFQGLVQSGVFYGLLFSPIISGYLSYRHGGRAVIIVGTVVSTFIELLVPTLTRLQPISYFVLRIFSGFFSGLYLPAYFDIISRWAVPEERQLLLGFAFSGVPFSNIVGFPVAGLICQTLGWTWLFYLSGLWLLACSVAYYFALFNSPEDFPHINDAEVRYITQHAAHSPENLAIPWKKFATSRPIHAFTVAHFFLNYVFLTIMFSMPNFMNNVHKVDLTDNGLLSATPHIAGLGLRLLISFYSEPLRKRLRMTKTKYRKVMVLSGVVSSMLMLAIITLLSCSYRMYVILCFVLFSLFFEFTMSAGYLFSLLDLAPSYVNILTGVTNTIANIAGTITPVVIGYVTGEGLHEQWNLIFYICMAFSVIAAGTYVMYGSSEELPWGNVGRARAHSDG